MCLLHALHYSLLSPLSVQVLFFDEADALAPARGGGSDDLQARRLLSELLVQLSALDEHLAAATATPSAVSGGGVDVGLCRTSTSTQRDPEDDEDDEGDDTVDDALDDTVDDTGLFLPPQPVVVIAATNLVGDLDPAFLRRFQARILVSLPSEVERSALLSHLLGSVAHSLTANDVAAAAVRTQGWSGSDLEMLCRSAAMRPLRALFAAVHCRGRGDGGGGGGDGDGNGNGEPSTHSCQPSSFLPNNPHAAARDQLLPAEYSAKRNEEAVLEVVEEGTARPLRVENRDEEASAGVTHDAEENASPKNNKRQRCDDVSSTSENEDPSANLIDDGSKVSCKLHFPDSLPLESNDDRFRNDAAEDLVVAATVAALVPKAACFNAHDVPAVTIADFGTFDNSFGTSPPRLCIFSELPLSFAFHFEPRLRRCLRSTCSHGSPTATDFIIATGVASSAAAATSASTAIFPATGFGHGDDGAADITTTATGG